MTLILDLLDGTGRPVSGGCASLVQSAQLTDAADGGLFPESPVLVPLRGGSFPQVSLLATASTGRPA